MASFNFLPFNTLKEKSLTTIKAVFVKHETSPMADQRAAQVGLLAAVLNHLPDVDLPEDEKSKILTGAHLYVKDKIRNTEYGGVWYYLTSPDNSLLYKNTDETIGVTKENTLDKASEREALMAFRNYIMRYNILEFLREKARLNLEEKKRIETEALKQDEVLKEENKKIDISEEEIKKELGNEGTKALALFTAASIAAEISKSVNVAELDKKINMKLSNKKASKKAPYLLDEIQQFDPKKLKKTTTHQVKRTLYRTDSNDPVGYMRNEDGSYDPSRVIAYKRFVNVVEPAWDYYLNNTFPSVPKPTKPAQAWDLGRDDPKAHEGVDWKKVTEGNIQREKRSAWLPEITHEGETWKKVKEEVKPAKQARRDQKISTWLPEAEANSVLVAQEDDNSYIPPKKKGSSLNDEFTPEQMGFVKSYGIFQSKIKQQMEKHPTLKHVNTQETNELVVDEEIVVTKRCGR